MSFMAFVLSSSDNVLTAEIAFVSLAYFNQMRMPMSMLPLLIVQFIQVWNILRKVFKRSRTSGVTSFGFVVLSLTALNVCLRMFWAFKKNQFVCNEQVTLTTFAVYVLADPSQTLDAEKAFVSLTLFNLLRFPMSMFPMLVAAFVQVNGLFVSFSVVSWDVEFIFIYRPKDLILINVMIVIKHASANFEFPLIEILI